MISYIEVVRSRDLIKRCHVILKMSRDWIKDYHVIRDLKLSRDVDS